MFKFIEVFNSAYNAALTSKKLENCAIILDWLTSFISYGDGLRRCVAIAVTTDANLHLFNNSLISRSMPNFLFGSKGGKSSSRNKTVEACLIGGLMDHRSSFQVSSTKTS